MSKVYQPDTSDDSLYNVMHFPNNVRRLRAEIARLERELAETITKSKIDEEQCDIMTATAGKLANELAEVKAKLEIYINRCTDCGREIPPAHDRCFCEPCLNANINTAKETNACNESIGEEPEPEVLCDIDPFCTFWPKGQCNRPYNKLEACWNCAHQEVRAQHKIELDEIMKKLAWLTNHHEVTHHAPEVLQDTYRDGGGVLRCRHGSIDPKSCLVCKEVVEAAEHEKLAAWANENLIRWTKIAINASTDKNKAYAEGCMLAYMTMARQFKKELKK